MLGLPAGYLPFANQVVDGAVAVGLAIALVELLVADRGQVAELIPAFRLEVGHGLLVSDPAGFVPNELLVEVFVLSETHCQVI